MMVLLSPALRAGAAGLGATFPGPGERQEQGRGHEGTFNAPITESVSHQTLPEHVTGSGHHAGC